MCTAPLKNATISLSNMPGTRSEPGSPCRLVLGSEANKPEVKASDVFLCGLHPRLRPRDLSGGLRGLQTGKESIRRVSVWSSPQKWDHKTFLVSSEAYKPEVKASDVFLCGLHPKNGILCAVFTLK